MAGITKGEWRVEGDVHDVSGHMLYCADIVDRGGRTICHVQSADHVDGGISREEAEMNARAISAMPNLIEIVEEMSKALKLGISERDAKIMSSMADIVIAIARGE